MQTTHDVRAPQPYALPLQIVAALLLAYLITIHTLASYLAPSAPQTALRLNSTQPVALTYLAERSLPTIIEPEQPAPEAGAPADGTAAESTRLEGFARLPKLDLPDEAAQVAPGEVVGLPEAKAVATAQVRDWLQKALTGHPLNAQAISLLATLSIGEKDDARALALMTAAANRSSRIPLANYWLMRSNYEAKNYAEALRHADRLARTSPSNIRNIAPFLGRIADAATDEMAAMLLTNPPWRWAFFTWLKGNIKDARMPLQLLLKLKESPFPPTPGEFGPYINLLIENKLYDLAYGAWLQSLDSDQLAHAGFIYNGGFAYAPSVFPFQFDWSMRPGQGVVVDRAMLDNANPALMIKFGPGRVDFKPVSQMTMLVPGGYVLTARYRGDIKSRRGLKWTMQCAGAGGAKLAETELINGSTPSWADLALEFQVPKEGCRAQWVRLQLEARSASETLVSGSMFIDDVAIKRQGETGVAE